MEDLTRRGTPRQRRLSTGFTYDRTCRQCGRSFIAEHHTAAYCSSACLPPERECPACGRMFRPSRKNPNQGTCSRACSVKVHGCSAGQYRRRSCKKCGVGYTPASGNQRLCAECRPKPKTWTCTHCSAAFTPRSRVQKRCDTCVPDRRAGVRYDVYGITEPQFRQMVGRYGGLCWVCRTNQGQCIDHCHESGKVRGWLCIPCNTGLGHIERPGWLSRASAYLSSPFDWRSPATANEK
ncbi:endonuclease domain-containing protein [Micromonospora sp. NBC_00421]|uniref:endonuclease domain-containing protein n=1 Tax=Micromonospora sp. NBC_00421 TaxID=2975976 RepID=UPI003FA56FFF